VESRTKTYLPLTVAEAANLPTGQMAVPITGHQGLVGYFIVDASDFEFVAAFSWHLSSGSRRYPSTAYRHSDNDRRDTSIHRLLLGMDHGDGREGDHRNGNPFDNRRENLREVDHSVNMHNRRAFKKSKTGIKGVALHSQGKLWCAYLNVHGKRVHTSYHQQKDAAVAARKQAEREHGIVTECA
jgi:hypothetical protein